MQMKGAVEEEGQAGVSLVPTAPPAHVSLSALLEGEGDLLSLEPPVWLPDSHASACTSCKLPFRWACQNLSAWEVLSVLAAAPDCQCPKCCPALRTCVLACPQRMLNRCEWAL